VWDDLYRQIESLPIDASEWQGFDEFFARIDRLRQEREQRLTQRFSLQDAIAKLRAEAADQIAFFELHGAQTWSAEACSRDEWDRASQQNDILRQKLLSYGDLFTTKAATYSAETRRRENLEALEADIRGIYGELQGLFREGRTGETAVTPSGNVPTSPVEPAESAAIPPTEDANRPKASASSESTPGSLSQSVSTASPSAPKAKSPIDSDAVKAKRPFRGTVLEDELFPKPARNQVLDALLHRRGPHGELNVSTFQIAPSPVSEESKDDTDLGESAGSPYDAAPATAIDRTRTGATDELGTTDQTVGTSADAVSLSTDSTTANVRGLTEPPAETAAGASSVVDVAARGESPADLEQIAAKQDLPISSSATEPVTHGDTFTDSPEKGRPTVAKNTRQASVTERVAPSAQPHPDAATTPCTMAPSFDVKTSAQLIAASLLAMKSSERQSAITPLTWKLLEEGRIGLAYHLSLCLHGETEKPGLCVPPWLIRAVAVGLHVRHEGGELAQTLQEDFAQFGDHCFLAEETDWNRAIRLLLAAAGMRPAVLASNTGAPRVLAELHFQEGLKHLSEYSRVVAGFAGRVRTIDAGALKKVKDRAAWQEEIDRLYSEADHWWERSQHPKMSFARAGKVWQQWVRPGQLLHRMFLPVRQRDPSQREEASRIMEQLSGRGEVFRQVEITEKESCRQHCSTPIEGRALEQLQSRIREATGVVRRWIELCGSEPGAQPTYVQRCIDQLRQELTTRETTVLEELTAFEGQWHSLPVAAGVACCRKAVQDIRRLFDPDIPLPTEETTLRGLLHADLLRVPGMPLTEAWEPDRVGSDIDLGKILDSWVGETLNDEQIVDGILRIVDQNEADWQEAFDTQSKMRDHAATLRIIEHVQAIGGSPEQLDDMRRKRQKGLEECRAALAEGVQDTRRKVEAAVAMGLLRESERAKFDALLVSIDDCAEDTLRFSPEHSKLRAILDLIGGNRQAQVRAVESRLATAKLAADHPALTRIRAAIKQGDVLTANEYIDMAVHRQQLPEPSPHIDVLKDFLEKCPAFCRFLDATPAANLIKKIGDQQAFCGINMQQVPKPQAQQAVDMVSAWFLAKRQLPNEGIVRRVLQGLGFIPVQIDIINEGSSRWANVTTEMIRDRSQCPVAWFGSEAKGQYRVLLVWDQPTEEDLINRVEGSARGTPLMVFHFGFMSESRRRGLAQLCRHQQKTVIIIDDAVIMYLCGEIGSRLPVSFKCTLPFTYLTPYTDTASLVASEMFYGRVGERNEIIRPSGACFIFGGRQLGKTALLRDVERTFHAPERGQIALWLDLKGVGIGYDRGIDDIWSLLATEFQKLKLLPEGFPTHATGDRLLSHVHDWLTAKAERRILLLLDEADRFLESDSKDEFVRSSRLKGLMDRTNRKFKVVFAGLHNVQRTTRQSNHPLAHYQEPICIGPLLENGEWREARNLIEQPFAALGYSFESPDLVTRILSQTNYYPNLIQLYCKYLLKYLADPNVERFDSHTAPPYVITAKHVEDAYQCQELQQSISHKLALTLELDGRYEVIAYAMAFHYLSGDPDAMVVGLPVSWIREQAVGWWPKGFEFSSSDDAIRVLADEMVGLGVLRQVSADHYGLRSPNVVSLLGTLPQIESKLDLPREPAPVYEAATFRAAWRIGDKPDPSRRSPLTVEQECELRARSNGVAVVFGSDAAGLATLNSFLELAAGSEFYVAVNASDVASFRNRLVDLGKRERHGTTLVTIGSECPWDRQWVDEAILRVGRLTSTTAFVRIIFVADPKTTWTLLSQDTADVDLPEVVKHISLKPWHDAAVRQWLTDCELASDQGQRERIAWATGNWNCLLSQYYSACTQEPLRAAQHLQRLHESLGNKPFANEIAHYMGLDMPEPRAVLQVLATFGRGTLDDLLQLVEGASASEIRRSLRWADLLNFVSRGEANAWTIDRIVARVLDAVGT
jgi:hypothetical protein